MSEVRPLPLVVRRGEGENARVIDDLVRIVVPAEATGGSYSVFESLMPPGCGTPPHVHHGEHEGFQVLEGRFVFHVDGEPIEVEAGDYVFAAKDVPHCYTCISDTPGKLHVTCVPGGFEGFFREVDRLSANGPAAVEQLIAAAVPYQLEFLPAPVDKPATA